MKDIRIMGEGTVGKGEFGKISVMGDGEFLEEFSAEKLNVFGDARTKKGCAIKEGSIKGNLVVNGKMQVLDKLSILGNVGLLEGDINKLSIKGDLEIKKNLVAKKIDILGGLNVDGDCEAEEFNCRGQAKIEGLLNCDDINIDLYGYSSIREIGGGRIKVKKISRLWKNHKRGRLKCQLIEADDIDLIDTECKEVHGKNIIIGPGCTIDLVECTGQLTIDRNSEVRETIWKKN